MQQCETFSRDIFTKVIKPFITNDLCPKVEAIVSAYVTQIKLVKGVSEDTFKELIKLIYNKVMSELFKVDAQK